MKSLMLMKMHVLSIFFLAGDSFHTISHSKFGYEHSAVPQSKLSRLIRETTLILENGTGLSSQEPLKERLQQLYLLLISSHNNSFKENETLIFALDSNLQQLPIGLLHDGDDYLVEKHPIALALPQIYTPRSLTKDELKNVTFAGISEARGQFSALPFVIEEEQAIAPRKRLINQTFTEARLLQALNQESPIIHIASHGKFSSDPAQTFLLAWDGEISLSELTSGVSNRAENTPTPIELLVLSACETAKGDGLATLGMAGITIQAGARSTIASLWLADDESTALLMEKFYQKPTGRKI